ncbi:RNA polymerase subunit sigma-70 [Kribbella sp. WER1]
MLRAFRGYDGWERRSGIRTWLHRIATNVCLDAQRAARRRPLPSAVGTPTDDVDPHRLAADPEYLWMSPVADAVLRGDRDPADHAQAQAGVRLALIAALQHLTPTQRAIFVLRDVLMWRADETAEALRLTVPSITNHPLRARRRIREADVSLDDMRETPDRRRAVQEYLGAFVDATPDRLAALLTQDVVFEMPPHSSWFRGRETVAAFLRDRVGGGTWRGVLTGANGQPAVALYLRDAGGEFRPEGIHVLDVTTAGIAHVVAFRDPAPFAAFGLPRTTNE